MFVEDEIFDGLEAAVRSKGSKIFFDISFENLF